VLDTCDYLETQGARITRLAVNRDGTLPLETLQASLSSRVDLVSLMHGNNEVGTIHPVKAISEICKSRGSLLHVDAAQSYGKIPIKFSNWGIDYLSISGHKLYAPKGVGCLLIRRQTPPLRLLPLFHGGGHERGFRSGTLNVPGIIGIGKAAELCSMEMTAESDRIEGLRNQLRSQLESQIPGLIINGTMQSRLPGNLNVSIPGIEGQNLLPALRNHFSASSGSACTSAHQKPSHVLAALGQTEEFAQSSIRFGIGRFNTEDEIIYAAETLASVVKHLRAEKSNSISK
jgi:cysteine desulfurase